MDVICFARDFSGSSANRQSVVHVESKSGAEIGLSTKAYRHCPRRAAFATGTMLNRLPSSRAWSVGGAPRMPTIYALRSHRLSDARSAMSSPFPCVEDTTGKCIAVVMKLAGGGRPEQIRPPPRACCG
jgi:hypothetical protein